MATKKKKIKKKPVNFEKSYNNLMSNMESLYFTLLELKDLVTSGDITNSNLIQEMYDITHSMGTSLNSSDKDTDPFYKDGD